MTMRIGLKEWLKSNGQQLIHHHCSHHFICQLVSMFAILLKGEVDIWILECKSTL